MNEQEQTRLKKLSEIETSLHLDGYNLIAGVDEAGRGCLAGPVVAAACIFAPSLFIEDINDSKKLTFLQRQNIYNKLATKATYAIGIIDNLIIDKINILQSSLQAMLKAVSELSPDFIIFDGSITPAISTPHIGINKADSRCICVSAASILAKHTRDLIMLEYHKKWPNYGFDKHKGYPTKLHKKMILNHGICSIHRKTFKPIQSIINENAPISTIF